MTDASGAPLRLFNSWTRKIETFVPIDRHQVRLYSCGPTVYDFAHLGNLRAYVFTDILRRTLNWKGWTVNHVINITDVGHLTSDADEGEDKMEESARRLHRNIWELAAHYTRAFKSDLAHLNILAPSLWSTATDHIQDMIAFGQELERRGFTYELDTGLYFDVARLPQYGRLARRAQEGQLEGARVEAVAGKRNAQDFAVWRRSAADSGRQMEWLSPWGAGAPGWHLECSVMSMKYLGEQFDIHTGGIDHREIHHCNEIAQNQGFTGSDRTGANIWMHNNFLIDRSGKMSKSRGGFVTLASLIDAGVHPRAYRLLCLTAHYRSELEFSVSSLKAAVTRLKRLVVAVEALRERMPRQDWRRIVAELAFSRGASFRYQREAAEAGLRPAARELVTEFDGAISEDLMTPQALPILDEALQRPGLEEEDRLRLVASFDMVLGLGLMDLTRAQLSIRPEQAALSNEEAERLIDQRRQARADRDFAQADALRDRLQAGGVELMDGQDPAWEWAPRL